jgi:hypothetical protein
MTACNLLVEAVDRGMTVSLRGDYLAVTPDYLLTKDFADQLRAHKPDLLAILRLPFVMAHSRALGESVFLCDDEKTRKALIEAGAAEGAIYTRDELEILIAHNRAKPFIPAELIKLHEIKGTFAAKITER